MKQQQIKAFVYRHLAAFAMVALVSLLIWPVQTFFSLQIIVLIYLLSVMVSTVFWGLTPGVLAAFFAFLAFNYFYIRPYHTLQVHATQDLITLIVFLIVAVVMSNLIGQAREGTRIARVREWEATHMYELISALSGLQTTQNIAQVLASHVLETFRCTHVEVIIAEARWQNTANAGNGPTSPTAETHSAALRVSLPDDRLPPAPPATTMAMITARGVEGELRLWFDHGPLQAEETRLLQAYSSQAALSLERIRLTKGEYKARVLEESDRLKSSLLNSVSHELRSPLAAIKASVSSLRSGTVDWNTAARQELLATIEEETDQLNLLVGNLLDMSRIESGALEPQRRWNSMSEIVMGVVTKMRSHLQGHELEIDLPDDLPLVPTDYIMIGQVVANLLSNSIKYAPENTTITISARKDGDVLHNMVINEGPPVPEEHLERIFDKFFRVTQADRVTGTGLGLSICKGIVEAHGGRIWAENQPGRFVFHYTLPLLLNGAPPSNPREAQDG